MGLMGMAALAVLVACGQQPGNEAAIVIEVGDAPLVNATAAAPAVAPMAEEVAAVGTAGLLPPRAEVVPASRVEGATAFAYRTPDAPGEVLRWYRASRAFRLQSELDEGGEHVLSGMTARPAGEFSVRLAPERGGGTTAMVLVTPRR